jgi:hypothetical protein
LRETRGKEQPRGEGNREKTAIVELQTQTNRVAYTLFFMLQGIFTHLSG